MCLPGVIGKILCRGDGSESALFIIFQQNGGRFVKGNSKAYGRIAQLFHWLSMFLIVGLAIGGTVMTRIGEGAQ